MTEFEFRSARSREQRLKDAERWRQPGAIAALLAQVQAMKAQLAEMKRIDKAIARARRDFPKS
jgi:hypothetical protein